MTYLVTMEKIRGGNPKRVKVTASDRFEAEAIAELKHRNYAAVDSVLDPKDLMNPVRVHFEPGNIVWSDYWHSYDLVISFEEKDGAWWVEVRGCNKDGVVLDHHIDGRVRKHYTHPDKRDRVVGKVAA